MTCPPQRRPWQIHLSTAIVMMLVSAVFVWANVSIQPRVHPHRYEPSFGSLRYFRGWPCDLWFADYGRTVEKGMPNFRPLTVDEESGEFIDGPVVTVMIGNVIPIDKGWYDKETGQRILSEDGALVSEITHGGGHFIRSGVAINLLISVVLLMMTAALAEKVIRSVWK